MNIWIAIISSLVIVYVRIWIINTIFSDKKIKIHLTLKLIVIGLLLVSALFFYKYILKNIGNVDRYFLENLDPYTLGLFVLYCIAFVLILSLFLKGRYKRIMQIIGGGAIFFIVLAYGSYWAGVSSIILYYLVAAYSEEYLKFSSTNNLYFKEKSTNPRDLIFYAILIGLGFSMIENLFYIIYGFIEQEGVNLMQLTIGRGLISTLIHIVSTSFFAFVMLMLRRKRTFVLSLLGGTLVGFGIHALYNVSLEYGYAYVSIPLIILCFVLLSYLLYQTDIIYEDRDAIKENK